MRYFTMISSTILLGIMLSACGAGGGSSYSCDIAAAGAAGEVCTSYSGSGVVSTTACGAGKSVASCPTANLLGTCTTTISLLGVSDTTAISYYKATGVTASTYSGACTMSGGTWK